MKRSFLIFTVCALLAAFVFGIGSFADGNVFLSDADSLLSTDTANETETILAEHNNKTGCAVFVHISPATEARSVKDTADSVFNNRMSADYGENIVVVVIDPAKNDYYVKTSSAVNAVFGASQVKELITAELEPKFAEGELDAAVSGFTSALTQKLSKVVTSNGDEKNETAGVSVVLIVFIVLFYLIFVIMVVFMILCARAERIKKKRRMSRYRMR